MPYSTREVSKMQRAIAPSVYNRVNLETQPERFKTTLEKVLHGFPKQVKKEELSKLLDDPDEVELYRQLTLMGDPIADAYAARFPEIGTAKAREMLDQALEHGIESVADAPDELVALITDMETVPEWLDWEKVERFSNKMRVFNAVTQDYIMRLAFMMTYLNGYAGLPMVMTGALTGPSAAGRMRETSSTFRMAALPGGLKRNGEAFKSAAKVRVMHAMVRIHLLKSKDKWDFDIYGTPIPQVDQMGAALGFNFGAALMARSKNKPLSRFQLDGIEGTRYLASLLGMHDYFLSNDRDEIIKSWAMLGATLRNKYDERAKDLNKATLNAYTRSGYTPLDKLIHELDVRNTRFLYTKLVGKSKAKQMGIVTKPLDRLATASLAVPLGVQVITLNAFKRLPGGSKRVDRWAIKRIKQQLNASGEAKYSTNTDNYRMGTASSKKSRPKHRTFKLGQLVKTGKYALAN